MKIRCQGSPVRALFLTAMLTLCSSMGLGAGLPQFQEVLQDVIPAVVHLRTSQHPQSMSQLNDPYSYFFQSPPPHNSSYTALGTGFLVERGSYVLTAYRNIAGVEQVEILLRNQKAYRTTLVGADRASDLALLKVEKSQALPSLEFGTSQKAQIGDSVFAVGQPLGFEPVISQGHIAAKGAVTGRGSTDDLWLLDVVTHPGNAGGPIVDRRGRVLGMALSLPQNRTAFGHALPGKRVENLLQHLRKNGKVLRAWLGLVPRNLPSLGGLSTKNTEVLSQGIQIENLIIDGPAARAGLQIGDLIVGSPKGPLQSIAELHSLLEQSKPGTSMRLKVYRQQKSYFEVDVLLSEIPSAEDLPDAKDLL